MSLYIVGVIAIGLGIGIFFAERTDFFSFSIALIFGGILSIIMATIFSKRKEKKGTIVDERKITITEKAQSRSWFLIVFVSSIGSILSNIFDFEIYTQNAFLWISIIAIWSYLMFYFYYRRKM